MNCRILMASIIFMACSAPTQPTPIDNSPENLQSKWCDHYRDCLEFTEDEIEYYYNGEYYIDTYAIEGDNFIRSNIFGEFTNIRYAIQGDTLTIRIYNDRKELIEQYYRSK